MKTAFVSVPSLTASLSDLVISQKCFVTPPIVSRGVDVFAAPKNPAADGSSVQVRPADRFVRRTYVARGGREK